MVMSSEQQQRFLPAAELQGLSVVLRTSSSEQIQVLGEVPVHVIYGNQSKGSPITGGSGERALSTRS